MHKEQKCSNKRDMNACFATLILITSSFFWILNIHDEISLFAIAILSSPFILLHCLTLEQALNDKLARPFRTLVILAWT
jgi:hypothetical protein